MSEGCCQGAGGKKVLYDGSGVGPATCALMAALSHFAILTIVFSGKLFIKYYSCSVLTFGKLLLPMSGCLGFIEGTKERAFLSKLVPGV